MNVTWLPPCRRRFFYGCVGSESFGRVGAGGGAAAFGPGGGDAAVAAESGADVAAAGAGLVFEFAGVGHADW